MFINGFDPDDLPYEMPENLKMAIRAQAMQQSAASHEIVNWLHDLSEENTRLLRSLLHMFASVDDPSAFVSYYMGLLQAKEQIKFDVCQACGQKHNLGSPVPDTVPDEASDEYNWNRIDQIAATNPATPDLIRNLPDWYLSLVAEYNMKLGKNFPRINCQGCGLEYINLQDRMLREPGIKGCHGCQEKSAWG